jgi:hypothetical protein
MQQRLKQVLSLAERFSLPRPKSLNLPRYCRESSLTLKWRQRDQQILTVGHRNMFDGRAIA